MVFKMLLRVLKKKTIEMEIKLKFREKCIIHRNKRIDENV